MNLTKGKMIEAARLTREGRLAEATALLRRSLGRGSTPAGARARSVESPAIEVASSHPGEPPAPEMPLAGLAKSEFPGKPSTRGPSEGQSSAEVVSPAAGQWTAGVYSGEAGRRAYQLYMPSGNHSQPRPLVVMLHGCTQSAEDFAAGTRMNFLAEEAGLLAVYPEQDAAANSSRCWNWFRPADQQRGQGEPALIAGITRQVMAEHQVDADRVYIAGLSAGGAMAAILAFAYPDLYAAVGVHSGLAPGSAHDMPSALQAMQRGARGGASGVPGRAMPLILFQGDQDATVHPSNAEEFIRLWAGTSDQPRETLRQGQAPGGQAYSCAVYQDPSGRTLVESWTVHGANHAWSGGSRNGTFTDPTGPDASGELVRFFREHSRTTG